MEQDASRGHGSTRNCQLSCFLCMRPAGMANFSACKQLVEDARERGANMVFLPEGFDYIGSSHEETLSLSESLAGETLEVWLSLGGFHERGQDWENDRRINNNHIIINDKGVSLKESPFTIPGPSIVFPELSVALQRHGAEILTYPSAFTCFFLAAAQVGRHHNRRSSYGHALVVDSWGEVLGDCGGEKSGVMLVKINLEKVNSTRRTMPVQQHRRDNGFYQNLEKT
ncbi:hypothetical protein Q5P01_020040 [Channa striata]|uniref:CN hydrolase domain-containing protein n=1 Tax=Channa striata TaxID=64152 RepID=A0AA88LWT1_CHASR|nr:hypothetical protein Q5P01_020040 [Channa striata]